MRGAGREGKIRRALLAWYRKNRRELPWRGSPDPYAIWLSEVMLQQTQVVTVLPYYDRFLDRYPRVTDLAAAREDDVLALWSGLGYYSRARNLHRAAKAIVREHGGRLPATYEALRALPGVGDYTAAAVASIAFGLPHAVLDGNVARVICRLDAIGGDDRPPAARKRLARRALEYMRLSPPSDWNQAMMELGALVCLPRAPLCGECPVARQCEARLAGTENRYPERLQRQKSVQVDWTVAWIVEAGELLLVRSVSEELFRGMWELPWFDGGPGQLSAGLHAKYGLHVKAGGEFARLQHSVTYRRVKLHAVAASLAGALRPETGDSRVWIDPRSLHAYGVSSIALKVAGAALKRPAAA